MTDELFRKFRPDEIGMPPDGFAWTWGGSLVRHEFDPQTPGVISVQPDFGEEWFEWHTLLSAISEARGRFVLAEIGAGYGRWSVAGAVAARRVGLPSTLICLEAEPGHFAMLGQHMRDNDIDPAQHRLIQAAATAHDGPVYFTVGRSTDWWGQAVLPAEDYGFGDIAGIVPKTVPGISLATACQDIERIDLIDMDIQGTEAEVIEASLPLLRERVRRIHIGTHTHDVEDRLRRALRDSFRPVWDFPCNQTVDTPIGRVAFQDGVQAWVNDHS